MSNSLRSKVIRLAHTNPDLRPHLLPLLKEAAKDKVPVLHITEGTGKPTLCGIPWAKAVKMSQKGQFDGVSLEDADRLGPGRNWCPECQKAAISKGAKMASGTPEIKEAATSPADRKKKIAEIFKRFKGMGDGMVSGGEHKIMLAAEGYETVVLEDAPDEEIDRLHNKYILRKG